MRFINKNDLIYIDLQRKQRSSSLIMKNKVIEIIRILGVGLNEIVFDFEIDDVQFNSIEWVPEDNSVRVHIFHDDFDYHFDFDGIDIDKQIKIYRKLSVFMN